VVIGAIEISALAGKFTLLITYLSFGLLVPTLVLAAVFLILLGVLLLVGVWRLAPAPRRFPAR